MLIKTLRRISSGYSNFTQNNPLAGYALTSAVCMGGGNLTCQIIMYNKNKRIDLFQVLQYSSYGLLISGPFLRYWWYALDLRIFKKPGVLKPLKMMLVDQSTTPFMLNGLFLLYIGLTKGQQWEQCVENTKTSLLPIVLESYKVWPAATLINFYLTPLHNRNLVSNLFGLLWSIYLTYLVEKTSAQGKNPPPPPPTTTNKASQDEEPKPNSKAE